MLDIAQITPLSIIFRNPSANSDGFFGLRKSIFIVEGVNYPAVGGCENLTYGSVPLTYRNRVVR